jgi:hypothetical protein
MNRTNILRQPGLIQFKGATFHAKTAINVDQVDELFDVQSVNFGKIEDRPMDRRYEIKLTPVGQWDSLSVLFPYFATQIGADIFGSSDSPLVVWTRSGDKYTFNNVAITSLPQVNAKVGETLLGEITFTALLANNATVGNNNAYYTLETETEYPGDGTFSKAAILTKHPQMSWGNSSPWDSFYTVDGVQITNAITLAAKKVNGYGTIGMTLTDYQMSAQFQPAGAFTVSNMLDATGGNVAFGSSPTVNDLQIFYAGFYVNLRSAALRQAKFRFGVGEGDNLIQGIEARATRTFAEGNPVALGVMDTSD